ncbi:MAG: hypothetical protein ABEJ61_08555 [Haloferacaceae archaeon]
MDRCPHLDYRDAGDGTVFETARAYCTVADRFVQPLRADVCNARYDLDPAEHCEIYRDHGAAGEGDDPGDAGTTDG